MGTLLLFLAIFCYILQFFSLNSASTSLTFDFVDTFLGCFFILCTIIHCTIMPIANSFGIQYLVKYNCHLFI
jgi:hypothetical protein